jgi:hypothetical protein
MIGEHRLIEHGLAVLAPQDGWLAGQRGRVRAHRQGDRRGGDGLVGVPVPGEGGERAAGAQEPFGFSAQVPHGPGGTQAGHVDHCLFCQCLDRGRGGSGWCGAGWYGGDHLPAGAPLVQRPWRPLAGPGVQAGLLGELMAGRRVRIVAVLAPVGLGELLAAGIELARRREKCLIMPNGTWLISRTGSLPPVVSGRGVNVTPSWLVSVTSNAVL